MTKKIDSNIFLAAIMVSLLSVLPFDIGFYTFTRIAITLCSIAAIIKLYSEENSVWVFFAAIAILYNPIVPIYLNEKSLWIAVNILTAISFIWLYRKEESGFAAFDKAVTEGGSLLAKVREHTLRNRLFFWLGRLLLLGPFLFACVLAAVALGTDENFDDYLVLMVLLFWVLLGPFLALVFNKVFFGQAEFWLSHLPGKED